MKIYCARQLKTDQEIYDKYLGQDIWIKSIYGKPELDSRKNGYCHTVYWARPVSKHFAGGSLLYTMDFVEIYNEGFVNLDKLDRSGYFMGKSAQDRVTQYSLPLFDPDYLKITGNVLQVVRPIEFVSTEELFG